MAPNLNIECHEYHLFRDARNGLYVNFQRLFPVDNLEDRQLRPAAAEASAEVAERIVTNRRRAKSVTVIAESGTAIPEGARLTLELETLVKPEVISIIYGWLDEKSERREVSWQNDPSKPLRWAAAEDPNALWTPSALRNAIFQRAVNQTPSFSAADAWCYQGRNLYSIAEAIVASLGDD